MKKQMLKGILSKLVVSVVTFCMVFGLTGNISAKAAAYKESSSTYNLWSNGTSKVYLKDDILYKENSAEKAKKIAGFKNKSLGDNVKLYYIYKDKAYVGQHKDAGFNTLFCVDLKTKKKKKISSRCAPMACYGSYIYADACSPSDTGAYPIYLYKITKNGIKKIKKMGKYIFGTVVVGKKIYYASYPSNKQTNMTVYSCNPDGSNKKKLYHLTTKKKYTQILMSASGKSLYSNDGTYSYEYNTKTKKLKKTLA